MPGSVWYGVGRGPLQRVITARWTSTDLPGVPGSTDDLCRVCMCARKRLIWRWTRTVTTRHYSEVSVDWPTWRSREHWWSSSTATSRAFTNLSSSSKHSQTSTRSLPSGDVSLRVLILVTFINVKRPIFIESFRPFYFWQWTTRNA